jgi:hypothetical protein
LLLLELLYHALLHADEVFRVGGFVLSWRKHKRNSVHTLT